MRGVLALTVFLNQMNYRYLYKTNKANKSWQSRYFELEIGRQTLIYKQDEDSKSVKGTIDFGADKYWLIPSPPKEHQEAFKVRPPTEHMFCLVGSERTFTFVAIHRRAKMQWCDLLSHAVTAAPLVQASAFIGSEGPVYGLDGELYKTKSGGSKWNSRLESEGCRVAWNATETLERKRSD